MLNWGWLVNIDLPLYPLRRTPCQWLWITMQLTCLYIFTSSSFSEKTPCPCRLQICGYGSTWSYPSWFSAKTQYHLPGKFVTINPSSQWFLYLRSTWVCPWSFLTLFMLHCCQVQSGRHWNVVAFPLKCGGGREISCNVEVTSWESGVGVMNQIVVWMSHL